MPLCIVVMALEPVQDAPSQYSTCSMFQSCITGFRLCPAPSSVWLLKYQLPQASISATMLKGSGRAALEPLRFVT